MSTTSNNLFCFFFPIFFWAFSLLAPDIPRALHDLITSKPNMVVTGLPKPAGRGRVGGAMTRLDQLTVSTSPSGKESPDFSQRERPLSLDIPRPRFDSGNSGPHSSCGHGPRMFALSMGKVRRPFCEECWWQVVVVFYRLVPPRLSTVGLVRSRESRTSDSGTLRKRRLPPPHTKNINGWHMQHKIYIYRLRTPAMAYRC